MPLRKMAEQINLAKLKHACSNCSLKELCLPLGLTPDELTRLDEMVSTRRRVQAGETLYHADEAFTALYAVRFGFFKTTVLHEDGREQVAGFSMSGEILGMDGIGSDHHTCHAVALEDSEVCIIPYARLETMARELEALQHHFHKVMSREIVRDHGVMMLLGSMRAEERVAAFLLNLSQRLLMRGYSQTEFTLRMTRQDIGSYLGLKLETVSRAFSRFQADGFVEVQQKHIRIINPDGLKQLMGQCN